MRYLVTGCAGFIGSTVAALLLNQEHEVIGIDNLNDAYDVRLKEWRLEQFQRLDIADREALQTSISSMQASNPLDGIVNFAARAGVRQSVADPWTYYQTNVIGTLNLLEACKDFGIAKFIQASTSSVYGSRVRPNELYEPERPHKLNEPFQIRRIVLFLHMQHPKRPLRYCATATTTSLDWISRCSDFSPYMVLPEGPT
jgi:nucleoside-diphosphate-sugar epimerase